MKKLRRQLLGLGFVAGSSLLAVSAAQAMSGPTAISIDGGPLGQLSVSGGVDGYGYYANNVGSGAGLDHGAYVGSALVELQKNTGILQFTIEVGSTGGAIAIGAGTNNYFGSNNGKPFGQTTVSNYSTGPLYAGYVTIAPPDMPFTISVGQLGSLEGYEAGIDWFNPSQLATDIWYVQNSQNRGVEVAFTKGPISATVNFGDGWDTGVFNYLQALVSYTFNSSNVLSLYYAGDLGRTGVNARTYGYGTNTTVGSYGSYYVNSQMFGGYYNYTQGNLNLIPEVQYVYAKKDILAGVDNFTSNFGATVLGTYTFANTPYSIGGWVEYEDSVGDGAWFAGPKSEAVGVAVSPTWQYKDLFARANAGYIYLLHNKDTTGASYYYGNSNARGQFTGTLEAGLLF